MDSSMYLIILVIAIAIQLFIIYCISSINTNANQIKKVSQEKISLPTTLQKLTSKGIKKN